MASKSRKKTNSSTAKKRGAAKKTEDKFLLEEVVIWITLAVCILLLIANFGFAGKLGRAVGKFMKGTFGILSYLLPFLIFGGVSFGIANKGNSRAYIKIGGSAVLFVILAALLSVFADAGGSLGSSITDSLSPAIGKAGTVIVLLILMIIALVVITGKSALKEVKRSGHAFYGHAKAGNAKIRAAAERRHEQRAAEAEARREQENNEKRQDRRIAGVSRNLTLKSDEVRSPEVREVTISRPSEITPAPAEEPMQTETPETVPESAPEESRPKRSRRKNANTDKDELAQEISEVEKAAKEAAGSPEKEKQYVYPPLSLLPKENGASGVSDADLKQTAQKLQDTLYSFGVNATVTNVSCGPSVTRYELQPEQGVKVSKIVGLSDDIKLNLAVEDIRIEAPIPGKAAVGIEVPNTKKTTVWLRDLLESGEFMRSKSKITFAVGKDIGGKTILADIARMPHLLVAGQTGSGKSVCINSLIMSILYKATPDEVKLIMIDPKVVELSVYNGIPHLLIPVVTDPKKASGALNWAVAEMTRRYQLFAENNVRDMKGYNARVHTMLPDEEGNKPKPLPQIVIIVDELADLMMVAPGEVEEAICRLAQLARAAGIHMVMATQRPSVNVITGLIKANMPSRIAFSVASGVDSRTILDMNGAEKLLGYGDMLFYPSGYSKPVRVQGAYVDDMEIQKVVAFLKENHGEADYSDEITAQVDAGGQTSPLTAGDSSPANDRDAYFADAGKFIIEKEKASIGMLQRVFKIGFNRAARIMDQLCEAGVVGPEEGTKPRKVLMSAEEFEQYLENNS